MCASQVSGEESWRSADSSEAELTLRSSQPGPTLPIGIAMELDIRELQTNANVLSPNTQTSLFSLSLPHLQEIKPAAFDRSQRADHCFSLEHANSNEIHFTQHFRLDFIS